MCVSAAAALWCLTPSISSVTFISRSVRASPRLLIFVVCNETGELSNVSAKSLLLTCPADVKYFLVASEWALTSCSLL